MKYLHYFNETFDSSIEINWNSDFKNNLNYYSGTFYYNDIKYVIIFDKKANYWFVTFGIYKENNEINFTQLKSDKSSLKILSTIKKAINDFIEEIKPEIFFFSALDSSNSRKSLYEKLAKELENRFKYIYTDIDAKTLNSKVYILSKAPLKLFDIIKLSYKILIAMGIKYHIIPKAVMLSNLSKI